MRFSTLRAKFGLLTWFLFIAGGLRAQSWQWVANPTVTQPNFYTGFKVYATAPDGAGNTIVAGAFSGTLTLGATTLVSLSEPVYGTSTADLFVARLSSTGQWTQAVQAGSDGADYATAIAVDATGAVTVTGLTNGVTATFGNFQLTDTNRRANQFNEELVVARLSPAGQWTQAVRADGPGSLSPDAVTSVALDAAGNAVLAGYFTGPSLRFGAITLAKSNTLSSAETGFVATLNSAGQWTQAIQLADNTLPQQVALTSTGGVVVAGTFAATASFGATTLTTNYGEENIFVARLTGTTWTQAVGARSGTTLGAMALTPAGEVVVTGSFPRTTAAFGSLTVYNAVNTSGGYSKDLFVARLSAAGTWTQALSIGGANDETPRSLLVLPSGDVLLAGEFASNTLTFGGTTLVKQVGPPAYYGAPLADAFLAQLTPTGTWAKVWQIASTGPTWISSLSRHASGSIVLAGSGSVGTSFSPLSLAATGAFVAQLSSTALLARPQATSGSFTLTPNPAHAQVHVAWAATDATARQVYLLDILGRTVRQQVVSPAAASATLDVTNLTAGTYLVRCGAGTQRLVIE